MIRTDFSKKKQKRPGKTAITHNVLWFQISVKDPLSLKVRDSSTEVVGCSHSSIHQGLSLTPTDICDSTYERLQLALLFPPNLHAIGERTA